MRCRLCGEVITRRSVLGRDPARDTDQFSRYRPWLHVYGMAYEDKGFAPHNAEPEENTYGEPI